MYLTQCENEVKAVVQEISMTQQPEPRFKTAKVKSYFYFRNGVSVTCWLFDKMLALPNKKSTFVLFLVWLLHFHNFVQLLFER